MTDSRKGASRRVPRIGASARQRAEPVARGFSCKMTVASKKVALGNHQVAIGELFSQSQRGGASIGPRWRLSFACHLLHSRVSGPLVPYTGSLAGLRTLAIRLAASAHSRVSVHSS